MRRPEVVDYFMEKIELHKLKWKMRKADGKVRGLVMLIHRHPNLVESNAYDRAMENHFARHPRTRTTTRPTPYRRGALV
jgi:hypothetical protein